MTPNWLMKLTQISATQLPNTLWLHGTDSMTAYSMMSNLILKPRNQTGQASYTGSLSSIPDAVYLTNSVRKAVKHANERSATTKGNPVVLVIQPRKLGEVHVDEDFVHMMLTGQQIWDNTEWYPSPKLEKEIFELADEATRATDYYPEMSIKRAVLEYLRNSGDGYMGDLDKEYFEAEGIIPDEQGNYEYDESMHVAKEVARTINDKYQKEAIMNFQSLAHMGSVQADEVYLIPSLINISDDPNHPYNVGSGYMNTYEELKKYCTKINPSQLLFDFMTN